MKSACGFLFASLEVLWIFSSERMGTNASKLNFIKVCRSKVIEMGIIDDNMKCGDEKDRLQSRKEKTELMLS